MEEMKDCIDAIVESKVCRARLVREWKKIPAEHWRGKSSLDYGIKRNTNRCNAKEKTLESLRQQFNIVMEQFIKRDNPRSTRFISRKTCTMKVTYEAKRKLVIAVERCDFCARCSEDLLTSSDSESA